MQQLMLFDNIWVGNKNAYRVRLIKKQVNIKEDKGDVCKMVQKELMDVA